MKRLCVAALALMLGYTAFPQTDSADYYFQKGNEDKTARRFLPAFNHYQHAVQFNPGHIDAQRSLGLCAVELRKYEDGKKAFLKVVEKQPADPVAVENLTNLYFWTRKWNEAIQYAQKAQQLKIGAHNHYIIAKCYYELENYGKTIEFLELAYKDDSKNPEVPYLAGRSFIEMSNYKRAAGCYEQAIALDSTKVNWMYEAGLTYYAIPDDKKAIYWFERAGNSGYKRSNDYLENLGNAYINNKEYDKGLAMMQELLQRKPQDLELLFGMGEAYYKTKRYQEAIDTWDKMLAIDNKSARSLYMIGLAYQKKGDVTKGQELCDKAIAMDPSLAKLKEQKQGGGL